MVSLQDRNTAVVEHSVGRRLQQGQAVVELVQIGYAVVQATLTGGAVQGQALYHIIGIQGRAGSGVGNNQSR